MLDFWNDEYVKDKFDGKTVMITGATGLIGSFLIKELIKNSNNLENGIKIVAVVRNIDRFVNKFGLDNLNMITVCECDLLKDNIEYNKPVDYIFHCASITDSAMFVTNPVETIKTIVVGTNKILEFAHANKIVSMVFTSSMEVYGKTNGEVLFENSVGNMNFNTIRGSYPEAKRLAENLCLAYAKEYDVPVKIVRLAQTIGEEISENDHRIICELIRHAVWGMDFKLITSGKSCRMYIQVEDAVNALITVLLNGENGEPYNAANENTYCSIVDLIDLVQNKIADRPFKVIKEINLNEASKYSDEHYLNLNTTKLQKLGWSAKYDLELALNKLKYNYILDYCRNKPFYIYGAGGYGKKLLAGLKKQGLENSFRGFVVTNNSINDESCLEVHEISKDSLVLVGVHISNCKAIERNLREVRINKYIIGHSIMDQLYWGEPTERDCLLEVSYVIRNMQIINYLCALFAGAEYVLGKNSLGKNIYLKTMKILSTDNTALKRWKSFSDRITKYLENGNKENYRVKIDINNGFLLDGAHRLILAKLYGVKEIATDLYNINPEEYEKYYNHSIYMDDSFYSYFGADEKRNLVDIKKRLMDNN